MASRIVCAPCRWITESDAPIPERDIILDAELGVHTSTEEHQANVARWQARDPEMVERVRHIVQTEVIGPLLYGDEDDAETLRYEAHREGEQA